MFLEKIRFSSHKEIVLDKTTIKQQWEELVDFLDTEGGVLGATMG